MINFSDKKLVSILMIINVFAIFTLTCKSAEAIENSAAKSVTENSSAPEFQTPKIKDFLITDQFIQKNSFPEKIEPQKIKDFLITEDFILKNSKPLSIKHFGQRDYFAEQSLKNIKLIVYKRKEYNFQNVNHLYVKIHSANVISTKNPINAGDEVLFIVSEDVIKNGKLLVRKGQKVSARVETISESGTYGVAADIILGNFKIDKICLEGEVRKEGFTHTYWVIPVSQAAGFFIPFSNHLFRFVHGGHAKIKPDETFEIQLPDAFLTETEEK